MDIVVHPPLFELSMGVLDRPEQLDVEAFVPQSGSLSAPFDNFKVGCQVFERVRDTRLFGYSGVQLHPG
jgi:hypothetical protein